MATEISHSAKAGVSTWGKEELEALASGYMKSRVFLTAIELGVFAQLRKQRRTLAALASELEVDVRALGVLLDALCTMGLLERNGKGFGVPEGIAEFLDPMSPSYLGGAFPHLSRGWLLWSGLTEVVRRGHAEPRQWDAEAGRALARAMQYQAREAATKVARVIDCTAVDRMLDLGGGPGAFAIAFARRNPALDVVLLDRDEATLEIAHEGIAEAGLDGRIKLGRVDFLTDDIGGDYDIVFLSSVLCLCGEETGARLIERIGRAVRHGGKIVIRDFLQANDGIASEVAAFFAVNMLVATPEGRVHRERDVRRWLERAGFEGVHQLPVAPLPLLVGTMARGTTGR
jgi:SAM-dependent methyltransferase